MVGAASICSLSVAQFHEPFGVETGSAGGTLLTNGFGGGGQGGWYNPVPGSVDGNVFTYAGNTLGFSTNPDGADQFAGMQVPVANATNRAQHAVHDSQFVTFISFDFNGNFSGSLPTGDDLGSVSLEPSETASCFKTVFQWGTHNTDGTAFNVYIGHWGPDGGAGGAGMVLDSPGAAWMNLPVNHWFRQSIVVWPFSGAIVQITLQDLTTGGPISSFDANDWFFSGGSGNTQGQPAWTDIRLSASGGAGNMMAYDNLHLLPLPEPATLVVFGLGAVALLCRRRNA